MGHRHLPGSGETFPVSKSPIVVLLAAVTALLAACSLYRGPVTEVSTDGEILGALSVSRNSYREGETVRVFFVLENVSSQPVLLRREDAFVQDVMLVASGLERMWSAQAGRDLRELELAPGESSMIEWVIEDLEPGVYTVVGTWWSDAHGRDTDIVVGFDYGPARY